MYFLRQHGGQRPKTSQTQIQCKTGYDFQSANLRSRCGLQEADRSNGSNNFHVKLQIMKLQTLLTIEPMKTSSYRQSRLESRGLESFGPDFAAGSRRRVLNHTRAKLLNNFSYPNLLSVRFFMHCKKSYGSFCDTILCSSDRRKYLKNRHLGILLP